MNVCQKNAVDLASVVSLHVFMLLLAVFNGEMFVYTEWKVTAGAVGRPDRDCRVSEYTVLGSVDGLVPVP